MPNGPLHMNDLQDSIPYVLQSARTIREYDGVMVRLSDHVILGNNQGPDWHEISLSQLVAQGITETTNLNNPQSITDTLLTITPVMVGVQTIITDRTMRRISSNVAAKIGKLAQEAIQRKKDEDGLTALDGATTSLGGAGTTMTSGLVSAAAARIRGNPTEAGKGPLYTVLHPFQLKDIQDELIQGVGTYAIPAGLTEEVFRRGFKGTLFDTEVYTDGNITIDASDDAKGGVFVREALILVDGKSPWTETDRLGRYGGGANELILYDEYAWGERSAGNWLYEIYTDASNPS